MGTELTLVRHGHAVRIHGRYLNSPLTVLGEKQANLTGLALCERGIHYDGFYCSPLRRARQTAARIGAKIGEVPHVRRGVQEWENHEVPELVAFESLAHLGLFGGYLYTHAGRPLHWPIVGRVSRVLSRLIEQHPDEQIAVVVHSGIISAVLAWYFPKRRRAWYRFTVDNCSLTTLRIEGTHAELVLLNDTRHLAPEETTVQPPARTVIQATTAQQKISAEVAKVAKPNP